jgi:eukaryotic-like serine/threonine-protein kinase
MSEGPRRVLRSTAAFNDRSCGRSTFKVLRELSKTPQRPLNWGAPQPEARLYAFGPFTLDTRERLLCKDGQPIALTPKVLDLLLLLVRNHGRLVTKEELMAELWADTVVEEGNLSQNVSVLRKALGDSAEQPRFVETVPRVGYRFLGPVTETRTMTVPAKPPALAPAGPRPAGRAGTLLRGPLWSGVVGLLLVAGASAVLWNLARLRPRVSTPPSFHRLSYSGQDFAPSASPDGGTVAFVSDRDGRRRIWLKQLAGGSEFALTSGPDASPRFSPDGASILFARDEGDHTSLYRSAVLGGEPRRLVEGATEGDWSPDGGQIVFVRSFEEKGRTWSGMGVASADGGSARQILRLEGQGLDSPRWSPDGRWIAARTPGSSTGVLDSLLLVAPDGGPSRSLQLPGPAGRISSLAWSGPRDILYAQSESLASTRAGASTRLVRLDVDTGRAEDTFWFPERIHTVDVLGAGRLIFDAFSTRQGLREFPLGAARPAEARWLTREQSNDRQPAYSPDGEWVAFSSDRARNLDLWKVSTRDGTIRRLTDDAADDWDPAFTPDGRQLVWSSNRSGNFEIWLAQADGSGARQLTHDGVDAENPTVTPDGRWIVYGSANPARAGLWRIRTDGSEARRIAAGTVVWPEVSPDGAFVAYRNAPYDWPNSRPGRVALRVVRIADGAVMPEIRVKESLSAGRSRWLPASRALVFIGPDPSDRPGLFVQDLAREGGVSDTPRPLGAFDPSARIESFGISPDGSRVAVSVWEQLAGLVRAENVPGIRARRE